MKHCANRGFQKISIKLLPMKSPLILDDLLDIDILNNYKIHKYLFKHFMKYKTRDVCYIDCIFNPFDYGFYTKYLIFKEV